MQHRCLCALSALCRVFRVPVLCTVLSVLYDTCDSDRAGIGNVLGLKRAPVGVTYRALKLSQTIIEPAHFKYANSFLLRSPAKSFVVQAPSEGVCKTWEHGTRAWHPVVCPARPIHVLCAVSVEAVGLYMCAFLSSVRAARACTRMNCAVRGELLLRVTCRASRHP